VERGYCGAVWAEYEGNLGSSVMSLQQKKHADNIRGNEYPSQGSHKLLSVPWSLMVGHGMIFNVPKRLGTLSVMWDKAFSSHD